MKRDEMRAKEDVVGTYKFGVGNRTIEEWFNYIDSGRLSMIDPAPVEVRRRAIHLAKLMHEIMYEKSISSAAHGRGQVSLWNNLLEVVRMEFDACQLVNMSICNENKTIGYQ